MKNPWETCGLVFSGDPANPKPGDHFPVKVGARWYDTIIDDNGTQRFVANGPVNALVEHAGAMFEEFWMKQRIPDHPCVYGLNELARDMHAGKWPVEDHIHFYTMFGYSVSGFSTLSFVQQVPIINPLWSNSSLLDGYASFADSGSHKGRRIVASVCDSQGSTVPFTVGGFEAAVVQLEDDMTWNIIAESTTDDFAFPNIDPFDTWMDAVLYIKEQE